MHGLDNLKQLSFSIILFANFLILLITYWERALVTVYRIVVTITAIFTDLCNWLQTFMYFSHVIFHRMKYSRVWRCNCHVLYLAPYFFLSGHILGKCHIILCETLVNHHLTDTNTYKCCKRAIVTILLSSYHKCRLSGLQMHFHIQQRCQDGVMWAIRSKK